MEFGMIVMTMFAVVFLASEADAVEKEGESPDVLLTGEQQRILESAGWRDRVGDAAGVWVSIADQMFRIVKNDMVVWQASCSTSAKGPGSKKNSYKTPLGWHSVAEKVGDEKPWGQVFVEKIPTRQVWRPGDPVKEDLVLTRVMALTGEEPGKNKGGDVDSYARYIYIHGTNDEKQIGKPVSHGCVRLTNDAVIAAYERIPVKTFVLITE